MMRLPWLWPVVIILSALAAAMCTFVLPATVVRPVVVMWFLFVCPGMAAIRFLHLDSLIIEWTLGIGLSFAIDAIVAGLLLYTGFWSPTSIITLLILLSVAGAIGQLATARSDFMPRSL